MVSFDRTSEFMNIIQNLRSQGYQNHTKIIKHKYAQQININKLASEISNDTFLLTKKLAELARRMKKKCPKMD